LPFQPAKQNIVPARGRVCGKGSMAGEAE
jgi:hypothetical protein